LNLSATKPKIADINSLGLLDTSKGQLAVSQQLLQAAESQTYQIWIQYEIDKHRRCHQSLKTSPYEERKNINPDRVAGTCLWVLNHPQYRH